MPCTTLPGRRRPPIGSSFALAALLLAASLTTAAAQDRDRSVAEPAVDAAAKESRQAGGEPTVERASPQTAEPTGEATAGGKAPPPDDAATADSARPADSGAPAATTAAPAPSPVPAPVPVAPPPRETAQPAPSARTLRIVLGGGAYGKAQERALIGAFRRDRPAFDLRIEARSALASGSGEPQWDVAEMGSHEATERCEAGGLERITPADLPRGADGTPADDDFIAGTLGACFVPSAAWSSLVIYDRRLYERAAAAQPAPAQPKRARAKQATVSPPPHTLASFFDKSAYPGKRALRAGPQYILEMALMADGVAASEVYGELATAAGRARAFARLEAIRGEIIWAASAAETTELVSSGKAAMAIAYSGRLYEESVRHARPLGAIWDGQIYSINGWVIRKASPAREAALELVALAARPEQQAAIARLFPYGPTRRSALSSVGRAAVMGIDLTPFLPTMVDNLRTALRRDERFWAQHGATIDLEWQRWLKGEPTGAEGGPARDGKASNSAG